jgi:polyisoprenoid-binding protein YceI
MSSSAAARRIAPWLVTSLAFLAAGCDNPAKGKPQATVAPAVAPAATPKADKPEATADARAGVKAETCVVQEDASKLQFTGAKITGKHDGGFKKMTGKIDLVPGKIEASSVTVEVETASVYSDADRLTGHLKGPDFFDVEKFPKASFQSTEIKPGGEGGATHTITGNLELHGVKKSISFPAKITVDADAVTTVSEFVILRKDFGIEYPGKPDDLIKNEVVIKLSIKAARKKG